MKAAQSPDSAASLFRIEQAVYCKAVRGSDKEERGLYAPDTEPLLNRILTP